MVRYRSWPEISRDIDVIITIAITKCCRSSHIDSWYDKIDIPLPCRYKNVTGTPQDCSAWEHIPTNTSPFSSSVVNPIAVPPDLQYSSLSTTDCYVVLTVAIAIRKDSDRNKPTVTFMVAVWSNFVGR